VKADFTLN